jgi:hypothetical protein
VMKPIHQTQFGSKHGNCLQACVASVLEMPLERVPHFVLFDDWIGEFDSFLARFGLTSLTLDAHQVNEWKPVGFHLIGGKSPRGDFWHSVVGHNGEMVHDPHPSGDGLRTIEDYTVFVALLDRRCPECGSEQVMTSMVSGVCACGYAWDHA